MFDTPSTSRHVRRFVVLIAVGGALLLSACVAPVRADQIDLEMVRDSEPVVKAIRALGAKNIAVLKFDAQIGNSPATYDAGTITVQMVHRLENLLVLTNDEKNPQLNILSDAGGASKVLVKSAGRSITWKTPEGRKELFKLKLPLMWDEKQRLSPDAFLTGTVVTSADLKETRVVLKAFTRQNPTELKTIGTLTGSSTGTGKSRGLHTDRSMLSSMGKSFVLARKLQGRNFEAGDDSAAEAASQLIQTGQQAIAVPNAPVKLEILLAGQPVAVEPDLLSPGEGMVRLREGLAAGKDLTLRVTNNTPDPIGILLTVNGRNTAAMDNDDITSKSRADCRKWILKPGQSNTIKGFYTDAKSGRFEPFKILTKEESALAAAMLDTHLLGLITMDVFGKGAGLTVTSSGAAADPKKEQDFIEAELLDLNADGGSRHPRSLSELKANTLKASRAAKVTNGKLSVDATKNKIAEARSLRRSLDNLIVGDTAKAGTIGTIQEESLSDVELIMSYTVRYYERSSSLNTP